MVSGSENPGEAWKVTFRLSEGFVSTRGDVNPYPFFRTPEDLLRTACGLSDIYEPA